MKFQDNGSAIGRNLVQAALHETSNPLYNFGSLTFAMKKKG